MQSYITSQFQLQRNHSGDENDVVQCSFKAHFIFESACNKYKWYHNHRFDADDDNGVNRALHSSAATNGYQMAISVMY